MKLDYNYQKPIENGEWTARFIFIAGRLSIDFTQTGGQTPERAYWERLHSPSDLQDWFGISPLRIPNVTVTAKEFEISLELREAIWRTANTLRTGGKPAQVDLDCINSVAAFPDLIPELAADGIQQTWRSPVTASMGLSTLARDAIDLFSGNLRERIRKCENPNCHLIFVDQSRPGLRRWCLMERCGNLQKTRRYRQRHAESSAD